MRIADVRTALDRDAAARAMMGLISELYPICRSITGEGLRATLRAVARRVPIALTEVPSGTKAFDWTVPDEWNIEDAFLLDAHGRRAIEFRSSNLHVVNYSEPVRRTLTRDELDPHLFSLPEHPDWIPYRTAYYERTWGFCLSQRQRDALPDGRYEAVIESRLEPGSLTYGELLLPGRSREEVLISCHCCHPSLCNDNLSGIAVASALAQSIAAADRRYSYRFLFLPGTIGSIVWLSRNEEAAARIRHGLVVACVGDAGPMHYKKTRRGNAEVDRAAIHVLESSGREHRILDFTPYGYDERQYGSPGFDLPVGSLTRTPHGRYPEYHTSADNPSFVRPDSLVDSLAAYLEVLSVLEGNARHRNTNPKCEPQLGKRGLYRAIGGLPDPGRHSLAMLWVLNLSDGENDLLGIAERSGLPFDLVEAAAVLLAEHGLLVPASVPPGTLK